MPADAAQRGRFEAAVPEVGTACPFDRVELGDRFDRALLLVQHGREIGPRGGEIGRQFERSAKQILGIAQPPDPRRKFGHHPDRGNIHRPALEIGAEQAFGDRQIVVGQRPASAKQIGVAPGGRHLAGKVDGQLSRHWSWLSDRRSTGKRITR